MEVPDADEHPANSGGPGSRSRGPGDLLRIGDELDLDGHLDRHLTGDTFCRPPVVRSSMATLTQVDVPGRTAPMKRPPSAVPCEMGGLRSVTPVMRPPAFPARTDSPPPVRDSSATLRRRAEHAREKRPHLLGSREVAVLHRIARRTAPEWLQRWQVDSSKNGSSTARQMEVRPSRQRRHNGSRTTTTPAPSPRPSARRGQCHPGRALARSSPARAPFDLLRSLAHDEPMADADVAPENRHKGYRNRLSSAPGAMVSWFLSSVSGASLRAWRPSGET